VAEPDNFLKYKLMCLRMAAECRGVAAAIAEPDIKMHYLLVAGRWEELADRPRVLH
jgi:hypothetical protein